MGSNAPKTVRAIGTALCVMALSMGGCATVQLGKQGAREEARGNYDQAVIAYAKLASMQPGKMRWTISLARTRMRASQGHFKKAQQYKDGGHLELAIGELQQSVTLDPTNAYAQTELEKALIEWQRQRDTESMTELERMKMESRKSQGVPLLDPRSNIPIVIKFNDAELSKIYEALSKATGINFLYDPKLDLKKKATIELNNVPFEKAMDTLMLTNKHFFKVMDENTVLIADDNQQKRREYEDEVIKTFFLSNADVKDVQSLLRTMLDSRKLTQNPQLNAITIRDTPNKVAIAGKIIEANDKAKAELIIDVELLEINRTVSKTLGINLTPRQYTIQWDGPTRLPLNNLGLLNQRGLYSLGPIPSVTIDFLKSDSGTRTMAKPQLRVTEGEKANLHIGDSVPIPTTTFNTTGSVGGSVVPITSFTYQEVGIVISIEPRVHHNKEVTLKLNVEVSQLGERVDTGQGVSQPAINSRQIDTVIRLKNGETNLLAGLISEDFQNSRAGFPGLMDTPGLNKFFSTTTDTHREKDLILTLTPHIIRIPDIRQEDLDALWIGNEANPHLRGDAGSVFATPFTARESSDEDLEEEDEAEQAGEEAIQQPGDAGAPAAGASAPATTAPARPGPVQGAPGGAQAPPDVSGRLTGQAGVQEEQIPPSAAGAGQTPSAPPAPTAAAPMNLTIAPARLNVAAGGTFSMNLLVNNVSNLQKLSLTMTYDPAVMEFDSGLEGIIMKQDGTPTVFSAAKSGEGQLVVEVARTGGAAGISRGGALAALRFRAVASGKVSLTITSVRAEAFDGTAINVNSTQAEVTVLN